MSSLTPVVISGIAPSLDGILYEALSQAIPSNEPGVVLARLKEILLFNDELGVFHASSLRFGITPEQGIGATTSVRCDYLSPEKLSTAMFSPRIHRGVYACPPDRGPHEEKDDNPSSLFCTLFNV